MCADRLAEDYNYEWENKPDEPDYYECELCGHLYRDDTKLKFNEEHQVWCCESCEEDIEEYLKIED
jgi:transcription elongation factor Elf1